MIDSRLYCHMLSSWYHTRRHRFIYC